MSSPVLHKILYEMEDEYECAESGQMLANPDRRLMLDEKLGLVHLSLTQSYSYLRLEVDGIPPVVMEALLRYMYLDEFAEEDFENGYSRNLLWRMWHAATALEMGALQERCSKVSLVQTENLRKQLSFTGHYRSRIRHSLRFADT